MRVEQALFLLQYFDHDFSFSQDVLDMDVTMEVIYRDLRLEPPKDYPPEIQMLMNDCFKKDSAERPSFLHLTTTLCQHIDLANEF